MKTYASKGEPATYHSREEQERRLIAVYKKWEDKGGVWSAAAPEVSKTVIGGCGPYLL